MKDTPSYCNGFEIVEKKPKQVTSMVLRHVVGSTGNNGLNAALTSQIGGSNASQVPIFYYLLQKPPVHD